MTGAELLALLRQERPHTDQYPWALLPLDALDGCVLLTPDEQKKVRQAIVGPLTTYLEQLNRDAALALLSAKGTP